jgi:MFS transporter, SP family, arabinose:H+ symporter
MQNSINKKYLIQLTSVAALGGLLFGFDIAIISGTLLFIQPYFQLTEFELGIGVSSLLFGCVIGSFIVGGVTEKYGRKPVLIGLAIVFALTSVVIGLATLFPVFVLGRFIAGIAVGAASVVSPMYISEVAPSAYRGRMVSSYQLSIVLGILISYLINYMLRDIGEDNWRWMFISGVVPSTLLLGLMFLVPESPRWLFSHGKIQLAENIITKIEGLDRAKDEIRQMELHQQKNLNQTSKNIWSKENRKVMFLGLGLAVFVQMSGINTIVDYAPKIFKTAGWHVDASLFQTFFIGIVMTAFTFVSIWAIDKFGRRPLYIVGSIGMTVLLAFLAVLGATDHFSGNIVLISILLYIAFFSACIGPVFWTLVAEIFPNAIRSKAVAITSLTQWSFNALIVLVFPSIFQDLGPGGTFGILAFFSLLMLLFSIKYLPETKGKTLEEVEDLWTSIH